MGQHLSVQQSMTKQEMLKAEILAPHPSWSTQAMMDRRRVPGEFPAPASANKCVPMKQRMDSHAG